MAKPINIVVKGTNIDGNDAPTVDDLLLQIQDFAAILKGVENAISGVEQDNIVWRVTDVTKNSPLSFELTPYPVNRAMNIDSRAIEVIAATSDGMALITEKSERPAYFTDKVITKTEKLFKRVTNGLAETTVDFSKYENVKPIEVTKRIAPTIVKHIHTIQTPKDMPYRELGSIEGTITRIERDGYRRSIVWLKTRIDGSEIKCIASGNAANRMGHVEIEKIWEGLRVRITGLIQYKSLGKISEVSADNVQFYGLDGTLPGINDIIDVKFAEGIESVEYLRQLREENE